MAPTEYTLVVGLGKTGLSCVRFLARRGVSLIVIDSRVDPPGYAPLRAEFPDIPVFLGDFDPKLLAHVEQLIVSPGISLTDPFIAAAKKFGISVIGDIELFSQVATAPIIAITGSNGKSTVTTLVGEMARRAGLRVAVGGNLGTPALDLLDPNCALYVLELSSFQLETTYSLNAYSAVVLNVTPDHLDRHGSMDYYAAIKARVYHGTGTMVINFDDPWVSAMENSARQFRRFTLQAPHSSADYGVVCNPDGEWLARGAELLLPAREMRIVGRHNLANALAALALAESGGIPLTAAVAELREFCGLPHRCQFVANSGGVSWYNDSKGTNVGATEAACAGFSGPLILIAGGQDKGQDFSPLRAALENKTRAVILIGVDAPRIQSVLEDIVPVIRVADLRVAVNVARELAQPGDKVLLSPACASFDMFRDYTDRGECFMREVRELLTCDFLESSKSLREPK